MIHPSRRPGRDLFLSEIDKEMVKYDKNAERGLTQKPISFTLKETIMIILGVLVPHPGMAVMIPAKGEDI